MPNHVVNKLSFSGDEDKIKQFKNDIASSSISANGFKKSILLERKAIDFNKIIPIKTFDKFMDKLNPSQYSSVYTESWGVRGNAYGIVEKDNCICFLTAWQIPDKVLDKIFETYTDIEFTYEFIEEGQSENQGHLKCINNQFYDEIDYDELPEGFLQQEYDECMDAHFQYNISNYNYTPIELDDEFHL